MSSPGVKKIRETNSVNYARNNPTFIGIRFVREADSGNFKAAERVSDLFLEGVDIDASRKSNIDYVLNTFYINMINLSQIPILSQSFSAFKITVRLHDRDKLFNPELWPQGI